MRPLTSKGNRLFRMTTNQFLSSPFFRELHIHAIKSEQPIVSRKKSQSIIPLLKVPERFLETEKYSLKEEQGNDVIKEKDKSIFAKDKAGSKTVIKPDLKADVDQETKSPQEDPESRTMFNDIIKSYQNHRARNHRFFSEVLPKIAQEGLTKEAFLCFYHNMLYRTQNTLVSIAHHIIHAHKEGDYHAVVKLVEILRDEAGKGDIDMYHLTRMEKAYGPQAELFGGERTTAKDVGESPLLLSAVSRFRITQEKISASDYSTITGCSKAHEGLADDMLLAIRKYIFEPFSGYYTEKQFKEMMIYFDLHRDDTPGGEKVEKEHQEVTDSIVFKVIAAAHPSRRALVFLKIKEGAEDFMNAQAKLWDALGKEMEELQKSGTKILPKSGFLDEAEYRRRVAIKKEMVKLWNANKHILVGKDNAEEREDVEQNKNERLEEVQESDNKLEGEKSDEELEGEESDNEREEGEVDEERLQESDDDRQEGEEVKDKSEVKDEAPSTKVKPKSFNKPDKVRKKDPSGREDR